MIEIPIVPLPDECVICKENEHLANEHPCKICKKNAWKICNDCIPKLEKCPICRENFENHNTPNQTNQPQRHVRHVNQRQRNNRIIYDSICIDMCKITYSILKIPSIFFILVYVGKVYIYLYCTGTCPDEYKEKEKDCSCDEFARRNNYWGDFRYIILELFVAIIVTSIIVGCCCKK